jgi:hypothetical protein
MSKIITPTDTITITIDNRVNPPRCDMRLSRDLPAPWVCGIFAALIGQLTGDMMRRLTSLPITAPPTEPLTEPNGQKN